MMSSSNRKVNYLFHIRLLLLKFQFSLFDRFFSSLNLLNLFIIKKLFVKNLSRTILIPIGVGHEFYNEACSMQDFKGGGGELRELTCLPCLRCFHVQVLSVDETLFIA